MGAIVVAASVEEHLGPVKLVIGTLTLSDSYATNGDTLDLSSYLSEIYDVKPGARSGYRPAWDKANKKVKMFEAGADGAALDEVANTTDLSAEVLDFVAWGKP